MESVESFKKPEGPKEGREQVNLHEMGHDSDGSWYGSRLEETALVQNMNECSKRKQVPENFHIQATILAEESVVYSHIRKCE